jgi:hypothetical protein
MNKKELHLQEVINKKNGFGSKSTEIAKYFKESLQKPWHLSR